MDTTRGSNSAFLFSQALHHSPADSVSKIPMCKKWEQQSLSPAPGGCLHDNLISAVLAQSPVLSRVCKLQSRAVVATASGSELAYSHMVGRMALLLYACLQHTLQLHL